MTIAWEARGEGEPVLFIQGAGVPRTGWNPQVDGLSSRFHCATFDNRGVGESGSVKAAFTVDEWRADAIAVMDALGWQSAHVVGHSLGGLVAQSLALDARARVKSLTLMCTFTHGAEASRFAPWIVWTGLRTYVGTRSMRRAAFLEILLSPAERAAQTSLDDYAASLVSLFGRDLADPASIAMKQLSATAKFDRRPDLAALAGIPTLVLSGAHDRLALPAFGRALAEAIPGARYVERDAAHGLPITRAEETNVLLAEHIRGG